MSKQQTKVCRTTITAEKIVRHKTVKVIIPSNGNIVQIVWFSECK